MFGVVLHLEVYLAAFYCKDFDLSMVVHPFLEVRELKTESSVASLVPVGPSGYNHG